MINNCLAKVAKMGIEELQTYKIKIGMSSCKMEDKKVLWSAIDDRMVHLNRDDVLVLASVCEGGIE